MSQIGEMNSRVNDLILARRGSVRSLCDSRPQSRHAMSVALLKHNPRRANRIRTRAPLVPVLYLFAAPGRPERGRIETMVRMTAPLHLSSRISLFSSARHEAASVRSCPVSLKATAATQRTTRTVSGALPAPLLSYGRQRRVAADDCAARCSCRPQQMTPGLWDDMCPFFNGCSGTVCAVGGEGREANATTALLLANAGS